MWMKTNFHKKGRSPGLALKMRPKVIWKWPVKKNNKTSPKIWILNIDSSSSSGTLQALRSLRLEQNYPKVVLLVTNSTTKIIHNIWNFTFTCWIACCCLVLFASMDCNIADSLVDCISDSCFFSLGSQNAKKKNKKQKWTKEHNFFFLSCLKFFFCLTQATRIK